MVYDYVYVFLWTKMSYSKFKKEKKAYIIQCVTVIHEKWEKNNEMYKFRTKFY